LYYIELIITIWIDKMNTYIEQDEFKIATVYYNFLNREVLPELGIGIEEFWNGTKQLIRELVPRNRLLLSKRQDLQEQIDTWHTNNPISSTQLETYKQMLKDIGYLVPEGPDFVITTDNVDPEIKDIAGPQLVVPITNARYALNAANARWGSLYDALYGTDVISEEKGQEKTTTYNEVRGAAVIKKAKELLDLAIPLENNSHGEATKYFISNGQVVVNLGDNQSTSVKEPSQFVGWNGEADSPSSIFFQSNGLHVQMIFDDESIVGQTDIAGMSDVVLESAITTIIDLEDSIAAVDPEDKVNAYRNWKGLMDGTLTTSFEKNGKILERTLNADKEFLNPQGIPATLSGRALLLIRNVGHLMTSNLIVFDNEEVPEGIIDGITTVLIGLYDVKNRSANSKTGSIYIVKPKMHGPEEVKFTDDLFTGIETLLGLTPLTIKMGIMDEERRTTVNLKECIRAASSRVAFINTGFLDRTGDEIHTSMKAGPMVRKGDMKSSSWISAYEDWNVDIGIQCGLPGKAQIGKGMWAMPDLMADMLIQKENHPNAGANTAWVPSPTAATLHALHYHSINVKERQIELSSRPRANLDDILTIPISYDPTWSEEEVTSELENNIQGILGYVVRWVDQGVGCSKVPDINDVGLMEDRATLRISSQHIANWLFHGICSEEQVLKIFDYMAKVVDRQNESDPAYIPMGQNTGNKIAFNAAKALVFQGIDQPSGYTEPILHHQRKAVKGE
jgi:malate synthase